ncbi:GGDEF domain-containing protein [Labrys monachus]|uniref:diguanylate cyclase n=1 Tax=Labrys monachus TaxID=217067 RepID=A0ABU0FPP8_9HYPH|nr:sensor domain-containing diguanylate cyclase [Labrys monachus]MDQ0396436.1 diguanylate cyclase (GGDEF)-like protein [Labrys monachus]
MKPFSLAATGLEAANWTRGPAAAAPFHIPAELAASLVRPAGKLRLVPVPALGAPRSGILLLWCEGGVPPAPAGRRPDDVASLAALFGQILYDRDVIRRQRVAGERFHDLFESVATGIIVLEGVRQIGLVNKPAADLLGIAEGEVSAAEIAVPMRNLRQRCLNAASLLEIYSPLQQDPNYAVRATWDLGGQQYDVDTHPILGSGRNGRIWLLHDVTAQHLVEQELRRLAVTDPLTGLNNRRHFFTAGRAVLEDAAAASRPAHVLMLDIDHFKSINDSYGHQVGDEVIRRVALAIRKAVGNRDLSARLGGEEFAILFRDLGFEAALEAAERLRAEVAASPVRSGVGEVGVRISIGLAEQAPGETSLDQLLARADKALYAAKGAGRDQVVSHRST